MEKEKEKQRTNLRSVIEHYEACVTAYGDSSRGVDWRDTESQELRYKILTDIAPLNGKSVLDVGCGTGQLYDYLCSRGITVTYNGIDIAPTMIHRASKRLPNVQFSCGDWLSDTYEPESKLYDIVIACGVFLVKIDISDTEWENFIHDAICKMYYSCAIGIAFNVLSSRVDYREEKLFYYPPGKMLEFALQLSRYVTIRHDYPLYEYAVYIYKNPPLGLVRGAR